MYLRCIMREETGQESTVRALMRKNVYEFQRPLHRAL